MTIAAIYPLLDTVLARGYQSKWFRSRPPPPQVTEICCWKRTTKSQTLPCVIDWEAFFRLAIVGIRRDTSARLFLDVLRGSKQKRFSRFFWLIRHS